MVQGFITPARTTTHLSPEHLLWRGIRVRHTPTCTTHIDPRRGWVVFDTWDRGAGDVCRRENGQGEEDRKGGGPGVKTSLLEYLRQDEGRK